MIPTSTPVPAVPPASTSVGRVPPVFVSHGSPLLMLAPGPVGEAWAGMAAALPRPRAILAVSAHWMTRSPAVSAAPHPETIHDFYGFPDALYDIHYEPPGAAALAAEVAALVPGIAVEPRRGLDHGAWVPLRSMYPAADIPVVQLAVMPEHSPAEHFALGQRLAPLTDAGVLILASGSITHNLRDLVRDAPDDRALPYVIDFSHWMAGSLQRGDVPALLDYRRAAPGAVRAHPTDEHLLPLFVALGAAHGSQPADAAGRPLAEPIFRGYSSGALAMDAYRFTAS